MVQKYSNCKEINDLVLRKLKQGWRVRRGRKHDCLIAPNNRRIAIPNSPSDWRALRNFRNDVAGLYAEPQGNTGQQAAVPQ